MARALYEIKVPGESSVYQRGGGVETPTEADYMEAHTTSMDVDPTFMEVHLLPCTLMKASMEVSTRFHGRFNQIPWK